ncbi:UV DNA damage repair endonuclease UvsE [Paenibacillus sp. OT2-17]|jgi:UV DNA damage endonuclease|uniref:UV DNA damage repair endonuclease UvsE n=1 Tax=unclassified Paenibacillus TaxID=185978 RepID=UPI0013527E0F|nr:MULTISPECIES: UV DNA damage repair endonuclease UvsE [unclassified Paenibacillus]MBP1174642.1 UV DNA damage endonuclease [Paenibacillus sp. PvR133]MXO79181.1 UV DNA damage repair endonuclease UvsE [Paenibacillus sp. OT2-17]
MIVRFGYVAMSVTVQNASPSKTMTMSSFNKIGDREAAIRKLERIAAENLHNTLRLLRHNRASDIQVYRFSSKLIPLATHQDLRDWDPFQALAADFAEVGNYVKANRMRVSFHPDHFTVLSTPRPEVLESSINDLKYHKAMLEAMGLGAEAKNNIHIGGAYGDKVTSGQRFVEQVSALDLSLRERLTLENDDKTFNAVETLEACKLTGLPMVLDIHHQWVNNEGEKPWELWPDILDTWKGELAQAGSSVDHPLPPKIHASSPKSEKDPRGHAEGVLVEPLLTFLRNIAGYTDRIDVMLEAKLKDEALFGLMNELRLQEDNGVKVLDGASVEIMP